MLSQRPVSTLRKSDLHGSDFTARSAYSARAKEGDGEKQERAVGGVCSHDGGKTPNTPIA